MSALSSQLFDEILHNGITTRLISFICLLLLFQLFRVNYIRVLDFLDRLGERKTAQLDKIFEDKSIDASVRDVVKEIRNSYAFKRATGIYGERTYRQALLIFYQELEQAGYSVSWQRIKRVRDFLQMTDKLKIRFTLWDKFQVGCNYIFSFIMLGFALSLLCLAIFKPHSSLISSIPLLLEAFVTNFFAAFSFYQTLPYLTAKKMERSLKRANSVPFRNN